METQPAIAILDLPTEGSVGDQPAGFRATRAPARVEAALSLLLDSHTYAEDLGQSAWDFAVELHSLRELGLTNSDVRWLVGRGLVEHAREITLPGDERRGFRRLPHLTLADETCFVLSDTGMRYARHLAEVASAAPSPREPWAEAPAIRDVAAPAAASTPTWDRDRQVLRVGRAIVKQFKVPAANQEAVLAAFQEEGWPPRIDDPLPPHKDQNPKRRLHDTINSLNRNQKQSLIRFLGDGSGQGVRWELTTAAD